MNLFCLTCGFPVYLPDDHYTSGFVSHWNAAVELLPFQDVCTKVGNAMNVQLFSLVFAMAIFGIDWDSVPITMPLIEDDTS